MSDSNNMKEPNQQDKTSHRPSSQGKSTSYYYLLLLLLLRTLDLYLHYTLLTSPQADSLLRSLLNLDIPIFHTLNVQYKLWTKTPHLILLLTALGAWLHQTLLPRKDVPNGHRTLSSALSGTAHNTLNALLFLNASTSPLMATHHHISLFGTQYPLIMLAGLALYILGLVTEVRAELQKRRFESQRENEGKVVRTGLWARARHVDLGARAVWRAGQTLAAGGWKAAGLVFAIHVVYFVGREAPRREGEGEKRFGSLWERYRKDVRWVLFPGVY